MTLTIFWPRLWGIVNWLCTMCRMVVGCSAISKKYSPLANAPVTSSNKFSPSDRNILAAIMGYSELALYDVPHGGRLQRHLEEVLAAGKRARDLVQQILAFRSEYSGRDYGV